MGCHVLCEGGRQCILQLQADAALNWRVSDQMCEYVSSLRLFLPRKVLQESVLQHVLVQRQGSPPSGLLPGTLSRPPVFSLLVKSLKMIVSLILSSSAMPDHNFIVKTIPVLSLVLPLGFIFSQSGMTSAFKQQPLRAAFSSDKFSGFEKWVWQEKSRKEKPPFTWNFIIFFQKALAQAVRTPSMHYQIAEAWLGTEDTMIRNLMTIKSQETCRENFSHRCFKFTLCIQIQRNELHVLRSQWSITLTEKNILVFSVEWGMIARKYFQWEKHSFPICLDGSGVFIHYAVNNFCCLLVAQGPGCVAHPFPQGWQQWVLALCTLCFPGWAHLREFMQIDEPKRGLGFPPCEGTRSSYEGIQYLMEMCCVFLSSAKHSCDFHSTGNSHMVHVGSEELRSHLGGYKEGKAASQVAD